MEKILCLLSAIFLFSINSNGQFNISDDIDLGPTSGNLQNISTPGEWGTTHGTPSYSPTQIWMWAGRNQSGYIGEGVYRKINISQGGDYNLGIGINHFTNNTPNTTEGFIVLLANDPLPTNCGGIHGCPIPSFSGARTLYHYTGPNFTSNELSLKFSTAIGESYKYLIIYPFQQTYNFGSVELEITCLTALSCTSSDRTFCGSIQGGNSFHKNIFVGSEFCQTGGQASSISSENTALIATNKIELKPNTHISINSGKSFIMKITQCPVELGNIPGSTVISSLIPKQQLCYYTRPSNTNTLTNETAALTNEIDNNSHAPEIYPNPTRDKIRVKLHSNGEKSVITIMKMDGQVIKSISSSSSMESISLSEFAPGSYLIKIMTGKNTLIKKVIKIN